MLVHPTGTGTNTMKAVNSWLKDGKYGTPKLKNCQILIKFQGRMTCMILKKIS